MLIDYGCFDFNARFVCIYLSKAVRPLKIAGDGIHNKICVELCSHDSTIKFYDYSKVIGVNLCISKEDQLKYNAMRKLEDRYEFYLACLQRAYEYAGQYVNIPQKELLQLHQQFREGGYKNEWIWFKKPLKEYGIYIILRCKFATFDFTLNLEVYDIKKTTLIVEGKVFRTSPDELCYDYKFKKVTFENDTMRILDFLGHPNFAINLNKLKEGHFNVEYLRKVSKDDDKEIIDSITW